MTAENNGAGGAPEGDDPFAYLYRGEGAEGSTAQQQPGVPRRSYNQVRAVGERQYGGQQSGYGQQPGAGYDAQQQNAHYAAPETMPGGRAAARQAQQSQADAYGEGGRGRRGGGIGGSSRNGLLIGAIAVVAAVVIGIGAAVAFNGGDDSKGGEQAGGGAGSSAGGGGKGQSGGSGGGASRTLPKEDAAKLSLGGGATVSKDVPGAKGQGGAFVGGINSGPGTSATWTTKVARAGTYDLYVRYGVPGKDMHLSLGVNGQPHQTGLNMKNWAQAPEGAWDKGWTRTFATVTLKKGVNTLKISCEEGDQCDVNLDQLWLKK